jgi:hypothetical protein
MGFIYPNIKTAKVVREMSDYFDSSEDEALVRFAEEIENKEIENKQR